MTSTNKKARITSEVNGLFKSLIRQQTGFTTHEKV
jgi:hypothetical protein